MSVRSILDHLATRDPFSASGGGHRGVVFYVVFSCFLLILIVLCCFELCLYMFYAVFSSFMLFLAAFVAYIVIYCHK